jgi:glycosyltransferase involved in cell wall biosynthesis
VKVLEIISFSQVGGAEKNTRLFTKTLARQGVRCWLAAPPGPYMEAFAALQEIGVTIITIDLRGDFLGSLRALRRLVRQEGVEVVHSHMYLADFMAWLATLGLPVARISTLHNSIRTGELTPLRRMQQRVCSMLALRNFHRVFAVSESMRQEAIGYFRLPPEKVVTALNSIDFSEMDFDEGRRAELLRTQGIAEGDFVVGCAGVYHALKSQITLIRAMALLRDRPRIKVFLLGDGPERGHFAEAIRALGLEGRVILAGYQHCMNEWYSRMDLFVQPSLAEALSRSILEAQYHRVPVVSSDLASSREVLREGESGLFFPAGDERALAGAIAQIHDDADGAKRMGEAGRAFVLKNCGMETLIDAVFAQLPESLRNTVSK